MDPATRQRVRQRAFARCECCQLPEAASVVAFHVEHIIARQHGGTDDESNLALACDRSNLAKGPNLASIDPETNETVTLYHPRKQCWSDHFVRDKGRITGRTPTGRGTVRLLAMNADRRVQLRRELLDAGQI